MLIRRICFKVEDKKYIDFCRDTEFIAYALECKVKNVKSKSNWILVIRCSDDVPENGKSVAGDQIDCTIPFDFRRYIESDEGQKTMMIFEALEKTVRFIIEEGLTELEPLLLACEEMQCAGFIHSYIWKKGSLEKNVNYEVVIENAMKKTDVLVILKNAKGEILKQKYVASLSPDPFLYMPYLKKIVIDKKTKNMCIHGDPVISKEVFMVSYGDVLISDHKKETETAKTDNRETAKVPEQSSHWESFVFWEILDLCDWDHEGDDEKVLKPVIKYLSKQSDAFLFSFHDEMTELLYQLDTKELYSQCVEQTGSESDDLFLYSRCVALINGKEFYKKALEGETPQIWDMEFESLLYIAEEAWAKKHKKEPEDYPYDTRLSYETGSGWEE